MGLDSALCGFVVGGASGAGKTSLLREIQKKASCGDEIEHTCICDPVILTCRYGHPVPATYFLTMYDLSGLSTHLQGRASVYCHAAESILGAILVFDITDRKSFESLDQWYSELSVVFPLTDSDFVKILIGNKLDKQTLCIPMADVESWAEKHDFRICLTAAHDGRGVPEIMPFLMDISMDILTRRNLQQDCFGKNLSATSEQIQSVYRIIYGENDWDRLGIPHGSNSVIVAKAYRRLAAQIHPDKCPINGSDEAFKLLTASKDTLLSQKDKIFNRLHT